MLFAARKSKSVYLWLFAFILLGCDRGMTNPSEMESANVPTGRPPFLSSIETPMYIRRSRASPRMTRTPCLAPPQPANGEWRLRQDFCDDGDKDCKVPEGTKLELGYQLEYTCSIGYRVEGNNIVYCRGNGNWSSTPSCIQVKCDTLNSAMRFAYCSHSRKSVSCDFPVLPKTRAQISCRPGYTEEIISLTWPRRNVLTCSEDGEWEPSPLKCKPVCGQVATRRNTLVRNAPNGTMADFPWHVSLYIKQSEEETEKDFICGATLIQTNFLLTAAHCVYNERHKIIEDPEKLFVMTGNTFREYDDPRHDPDIVRKGAVKKVHVYHTYHGLTGKYLSDIALLELKQPFVASEILLPVCLDNFGYDESLLEPGVYGRLAGFGITATGESSPNLQSITVPYIPHNDCKVSKNAAEIEIFLTRDKFCAGYTNGSAICEGDGGGGLTFQKNGRWYVMGITSVGLGIETSRSDTTCQRYAYTLYTRVSEYLEWILEVISDIEQPKQSFVVTSAISTSTVTRLTTTQSSNTPTGTTAVPIVAVTVPAVTVTVPTVTVSAIPTPTKNPMSLQDRISSETSSTCLVPPHPSNGTWKLHRSLCPDGVACDISPGTGVEPSSPLVYECDPGFKPPGNVEVYCGHGGSWTPLPICTEIKCSALNTFSRIAFCTTQSGDKINCDSPMLLGTRAEISCRPGYKRDLSHEFSLADVECDSDGNWTPDPITCTRVCGTVATDQREFVANGTVEDIRNLPWHASIYIEKITETGSIKEFLCGATLIEDNLLLTAGHCIYNGSTATPADPRELFVMMGNVVRDYDSPLHNPATVRKGAVKNAYRNCLYFGREAFKVTDGYEFTHDIGLLELYEPFFPSEVISPACLDLDLNFQEVLDSGALGKIAGFKEAESGASSGVLQSITLPSIPNDCGLTEEQIYEDVFITDDKFCAGYTNGSAACLSDYGSGLVFENKGIWYVMGVLIADLGVNIENGEIGLCDKFSYSIYTRLSYYTKWMKRIIFDLKEQKFYPSCKGANLGEAYGYYK